MENFLNRACALVASCLNDDLKDVTRARTTVDELIIRIEADTVDESLVLRQSAIKCHDLALSFVEGPELDSVVVHSDEAITHSVEKLHILALLLQLIARWRTCFRSTLRHVPHNYLVPVAQPTKRDEIGLIAGEG